MVADMCRAAVKVREDALISLLFHLFLVLVYKKKKKENQEVHTAFLHEIFYILKIQEALNILKLKGCI